MSYELFVKNSEPKIEFLSRKSIVIFAIVTMCLLVGIFPGWTLKKLIRLPHPASQLSVYYLSRFSDQEPMNFSWRYNLIQEQMEIGQWAEAKQQIALLSHYPAQEKMSAFLKWELDAHEAFVLKDKKEKTKRYAILKKQLSQFLTLKFDPYFLWRVGEIALELGDEGIATVFLERANQIEPVRDPNESMAIGERALASGAYRVSAKFYFLAAEQVGDYLVKRKAMRLGLSSLRQGGFQSQGLLVIRKLNHQYLLDRGFLIFLSEYALSAGDPKLASEFIKKALLWHGESK